MDAWTPACIHQRLQRRVDKSTPLAGQAPAWHSSTVRLPMLPAHVRQDEAEACACALHGSMHVRASGRLPDTTAP
eukprot:254243-Chlamydomonas_euryale.AAC.3